MVYNLFVYIIVAACEIPDSNSWNNGRIGIDEYNPTVPSVNTTFVRKGTSVTIICDSNTLKISISTVKCVKDRSKAKWNPPFPQCIGKNFYKNKHNDQQYYLIILFCIFRN